MPVSKEQKERIKCYLLNLIDDEKTDYVKRTSEKFNISSTSVYRFLRSLQNENIIEKSEKRQYTLIKKENNFIYYPQKEALDESVIFDEIKVHFPSLTPEAEDAWNYAFSEMMNNAIEHSGASEINCILLTDALSSTLILADNGIGIFKKIKNFIQETENRNISLSEAVTILFPGKFTTNSERHSGEGIFFTSRIMDIFWILSSGLFFTHNKSDLAEPEGKIYQLDNNQGSGTVVFMKLANNSNTEVSSVFDQYSNDFCFNRTVIPLASMIEGNYPISRSQARRVVRYFSKFEDVVLNCKDIRNIGQAFAHEIFVVFARQHPNIKITYKNASYQVEGMIKRVLNTDAMNESSS